MIKKTKFGECLRLLLSALNISSNRLSKAINVDSSLISRWLHEKRIPSYRTSYIENISEYLSKNILNSFQKQRLDGVINSLYENIDNQMSVKDQINKLLLESQGYSLECKKSQTKKKSPSATKALKTKNIHASDIKLNLDSIKECENNLNEYTSLISLSPEDKIVIGDKNILSAFLLLLENATKFKNSVHDTIYISFSTDTSLLDNNIDFNYFRNVILKVIKNGWKVVFLFKINNNFNRTLNFLNFSNELIATGKFLVHYYKKYDTFFLGKEIIVVPGIGALSCYSTNPNSLADFGFYINNDIAINLFKNYFHALLSRAAIPLTKYYAENEYFEFNCSLIEFEDRIGKRFLCKDSFSTLTLPISIYEKLLKKINFSNEQRLESIKLFKRKLNSFLVNLQYCEHFDIYILSSIQHLIRHKQISFRTFYGTYCIDLEIKSIISHLENIIYLLKTYDNYKIAFTNKNVFIGKDNIKFNCWVKEKHDVTIEILETPKNISKVKISIEEPMVANAFEMYFKEWWEDIAPINKDKNEVIKWLEHQVSTLKTASKN